METLIRFLTGAAFLMLSFCAFAQANPDPTEKDKCLVVMGGDATIFINPMKTI